MDSDERHPTIAHQPITREWTEAHEERELDQAAARSGRCFDRPLPEDPDPYRTCFVRDRDRVLHCAAFRRLKAKTQVFVIDEDDFYRTRLTHTLEVTQLARFLSKALRLNEDLAEVLALVHDIGHPPFGHEGESILNDCTGVSFDHNRHALRIVDVLESPYHDREGLNLTHVVRRMILKHGGEAGRGAVSTPGRMLEAQVADIADSTAYHHHDLEDGLRSGVLTLPELQELSIWNDAVVAAGPVPEDRTGTKAILNQMLKSSLFDLIDHSGRGIAALTPLSADQIAAERHEVIGHSEKHAAQIVELGQFLLHRFYRHARVIESTHVAEQAISTIVTHYLQRPEELPRDYRRRSERDGLERSVCDYVAGMTDSFALNEWHRIDAEDALNATHSLPSLQAETAAPDTGNGEPGEARPDFVTATGLADAIALLEDRISYQFTDSDLAATSLTHASARTETVLPNERLEFLGDAVLGLVVGLELYTRHPDQPEGELSRMKATTVSRHALHTVAQSWRLQELLFLGPGFRDADEVPPSVIADAVEAVLGAVYIDGGLDAVTTIVLNEFEPLMSSAAAGRRSRNAKSELQAFTQGRLGQTPHYHLLAERGPDHRKQFTIAAVLAGVRVAVATGRNKRSAEQRAARNAMHLLREAVDQHKTRDDVLNWMASEFERSDPWQADKDTESEQPET